MSEKSLNNEKKKRKKKIFPWNVVVVVVVDRFHPAFCYFFVFIVIIIIPPTPSGWISPLVDPSFARLCGIAQGLHHFTSGTNRNFGLLFFK